MSWKSIVITGLLCVVAAPVFAVPSLSITNTGLDASGNWTWNVLVTPTGGSSLAVELGLRESFAGSQFVSATIGGAPWDTANPGTQIFNWETTDVDGKYVGLQTNAALDEIFLAYGSAIQANPTQAQLLTIKTAGPTDARLSTSLQLLGKYGTGGVNGRIAEGLGTPPGTNYSNFAGTATRTIVIGDVNQSGTAGGGPAVTGADFSILLASLNKNLGSRTWAQGDLNGSTSGTEVTGADFSLLLSCLNKNSGACATSSNAGLAVNGVAGGAGSLGGVAVPEPASIALFGMAIFGLVGVARRR